mmetsp:Transcript_15060/g.21099  ORF Transcript_15060/g.21099 Transcript_15060/m.21099 type:complete len:85 (+) Transcript_15060:42-296(+)
MCCSGEQQENELVLLKRDHFQEENFEPKDKFKIIVIGNSGFVVFETFFLSVKLCSLLFIFKNFFFCVLQCWKDFVVESIHVSKI